MKGPVIKMSGDAADKLAACFAWACHSTEPTEQRYFDALRAVVVDADAAKPGRGADHHRRDGQRA
jgi:hypothetical protein